MPGTVRVRRRPTPPKLPARAAPRRLDDPGDGYCRKCEDDPGDQHDDKGAKPAGILFCCFVGRIDLEGGEEVEVVGAVYLLGGAQFLGSGGGPAAPRSTIAFAGLEPVASSRMSCPAPEVLGSVTV